MKNIKILLMVLMVLLAGCSAVGHPTSADKETTNSKPSAPLNVKLGLLPMSSSKEAVFTFTVNPIVDEQVLGVNMSLPKGVEIINGNLSHNYANLKAGNMIENTIKVSFKEDGNYTIEAQANSNWQPSYTYGKKDRICVTVSQEILREVDCINSLPDSEPSTQSATQTSPISKPGENKNKFPDTVKSGYAKNDVEMGPQVVDTATANAVVVSVDDSKATFRIMGIISYSRYENATYPALQNGDVIGLSIDPASTFTISNYTKYIAKDCPKPVTTYDASGNKVGMLGAICESNSGRLFLPEETRNYLSGLIGKTVTIEGITSCGNGCKEQTWRGGIIRIENPDVIE